METEYIGYFGSQDRAFFLPMARITVVERESGNSIFEIFHWLGEHLAQVGDEIVLAGPSPATLSQCHLVIENGLIGGGVGDKEARDEVRTYGFPARPAIRDMALAWEILRATIYGVTLKKKDDQAGDQSDPSPSNGE